MSEQVNLYVYDRLLRKRHQVTLRVPTRKRDRRKTNTSTFANFIHQKDANIAVFMILEINKSPNIPIYTVHDNFITNALYTKKVSDTYIKIFTDGPDPLKYINNYINLNLKIEHDMDSKTFLSNPIPINYIRETLQKCIPSNLSNSQIQVWENKIETFLNCYEEYIQQITIGGFNDAEKHSIDESFMTETETYNDNWKKFKDEMNVWHMFSYNYSLHL